MAKRFKNKKKVRVKPYILMITTAVLLGMIIYSGYHIIAWLISNSKNEEIKEAVSQYITTDATVENSKNTQENNVKVDFKALKERNADTIAWLRVNNTEIDYPVVKGTDNEYYLTHNFDKEYNKAGWIFADYRDKFNFTDWNIVIYGHNMKSNLMFGTLKNVLNKEWYNNEENRYISLITENENGKYEIFSIYETEADDYSIKTDFKNDTEYSKFIETIKKKSIKDFGVKVSSQSGILTLSTCAEDSDHRIVVHAVKVK